MCLLRSLIFFLVFKCVIYDCQQFIFHRTIEAVGIPYYKILFSIGDCKETILYFEKKVWPQLRMNRIFDIYYKSNNHNIKVSRVELRLVVNDTACQAYTKNGVGAHEFAATLFLPTNLATVFYTLTIYTCNKDTIEKKTDQDDPKMLPFYIKRRLNYEYNH